MWEKYSLIKSEDLEYFSKLHDKKEKDWYNNQFHISGFSGSVNDPNGLTFLNGKYYIFFQNCPFSISHFNKSWGLYTTKDFINYKYEGITITPSCDYDKDGVYSGSAYVNKDQEIDFYYTGNIKLDETSRTSSTIKANIDFINKVVTKEVLFECDLQKYTGHYRDPVIFKNNEQFYMLNGAQDLSMKGKISLYKKNNDKWNYDSDFNFNNEENSYMIECPNYFKIDNKLFLITCPEKNEVLADGGHFVECCEVSFDENEKFSFLSKSFKIDLGYDFYAPQIFNNTLNRVIMLGWLGNSKSNPFPPEVTSWSNQLTIPRELFLKDNFIYQKPIEELKNLRLNVLELENDSTIYENGTLELNAKNINDDDFVISISNENEDKIIIENKNNIFLIDRSNASYLDEENLPSIIKYENLKINSLRILFDRSCLEIFINDGQKVISLRYFVKEHKKLLTNLKETKIYQLKSNNYEWENIIYKNVLKGE